MDFQVWSDDEDSFPPNQPLGKNFATPPPGPQFLTATLLCYGPICLMTHVSCKWWTASRKRNCVHGVMMFIVFMRLLYDDEESIGVELRSGFHEFTFYEVFKHHAEMSGFMMRYDIVAGEESHGEPCGLHMWPMSFWESYGRSPRWRYCSMTPSGSTWTLCRNGNVAVAGFAFCIADE